MVNGCSHPKHPRFANNVLQEAVRGAPPPDKKLLEHQFVFACVWAFGGCMLVDKVSDYRTQFSKWWISEYKNVQFPEKVENLAQYASLPMPSLPGW